MEPIRCSRALVRNVLKHSSYTRPQVGYKYAPWRGFQTASKSVPKSWSTITTTQVRVGFRGGYIFPKTLSKIPSCRTLSTKPLPRRGRMFRFFYRTFALAGFFMLTAGGLLVAFFIYDASTYSENPEAIDIPVSEAALSPKRGGPKNLPIAQVLVDDDDTEINAACKTKPKLVILGTGWASVALLKSLNAGDYHVTVVSPVNHFLFTPMLPSATVGTLEFRSLVEPVRRIVNRIRGHFLNASAEDIEFSEKLVEVSQTDANGIKQHFYLPYDKLVIGVGKHKRDRTL